MADPAAATTTRRKFTIRKREEPTNLGVVSADLFNSGSVTPARRFLCDTAFTKRIVETAASLTDIVPSATRLGEGSYGFTTSADLHVRPTKGASRAEFNCISALKTVKSMDSDLSSDIVIEIATYARTKLKPCIAQGLFAKLLPREVKLVMEHYIKDLQKLWDENVAHNFPAFESDYELLGKCVMVQILTGLKGLHDENILHRDLKPENVLLAQTGNVFVTDFGLSFHDPLGIDRPQQLYQYDTTPTIKPPEAVDRLPISSKYDIWSAGCCMAFFLTNEHYFDFWKLGGNWASDMKRRNETAQKYGEKRDMILKLVAGYTHTKTGKDLYSAECVDLLEKLLAMDPADRPTADEALAHPWFKGITVKTAQNTIKQLFMAPDMGHVTTGRPVRISYIREKTRRIKEAARLRGDPGAQSNTLLSEYMTVLPVTVTDTIWKPFYGTGAVPPQTRATMFSTTLSYISRIPSIPITAYLHMLEFHDRLMNRYQLSGASYAETVFSSYVHAVLLNPVTATSGAIYKFSARELQSLTSNWVTKDIIRTTMRRVIRLLNGDLFAQRGGLVEQVAQTLLFQGGVDPAKDYVLITRRLLWFLLCYLSIDATKRPFATVLELAGFLATQCEKRPDTIPAVPADLSAAHAELKTAFQNAILAQNSMAFFSMVLGSVPPEAIGSVQVLTGVSMERTSPNKRDFEAISQCVKNWTQVVS